MLLLDPYDLEKELVRMIEIAQRHCELNRAARRDWETDEGCVCFECATVRSIHRHLRQREELGRMRVSNATT